MIILFDIESTGLAPFEKICTDPREIKEHRILAISVYNIDNGVKECFVGEDEKEILTKFSKFIENMTILIGFNVDFDINFIKVRCFVNNIRLPNPFKNLNNLSSFKIIDLRSVLNSGQYAVGSLSDYARKVGCEIKTENGKQMPIFYQNKQWDMISVHSLEDIEITKVIYDRCKECNLI